MSIAKENSGAQGSVAAMKATPTRKLATSLEDIIVTKEQLRQLTINLGAMEDGPELEAEVLPTDLVGTLESYPRLVEDHCAGIRDLLDKIQEKLC